MAESTHEMYHSGRDSCNAELRISVKAMIPWSAKELGLMN
jgi:hypothetical protein